MKVFRSITNLVLISISLISIIILIADLSFASDVRSAILQPMKDDIIAAETGVLFLQQVADEHMAELSEELAWHEKQFKQIDAKTADLKKAWKERLNAAKSALSTVNSLAKAKDGKSCLPHWGWQSYESMQGHVTKLKEEYDKVQKEIDEGKYKFHVHAIGHIAKNQLQSKIDDRKKKLKEIQKQVAKGTWNGRIPVFERIDRESLEKQIANNEKEISKIEDKISRGEYSVHIPGLGRINRNELEGKINSLNDDMQEFTKKVGQGKYTIHRPIFGRIDEKELEKKITAQEKQYDAYKKEVSDSVFKTHFPKEGWLSGKNILKKIEGLKKKIDKISKDVTNGKYNVAVPKTNIGRINREEIEKKLKESDIPEKIRTALNKALSDISTASALDIAIYGLEKSKWTEFLGEVAKYAKPWLEYKKLWIEQLSRHQDDFNENKTMKLKIMKMKLLRLENSKVFLP